MQDTQDNAAQIAKIIASVTDGKTAASQPQLIVVSGGMQTGQAVIHRLMLDEKFVDTATTVVITPAAFITMPGFDAHKHVQHPEKTTALVKDYQQIVKAMVAGAIANGSSVLLVDHAEDFDFINDVRKSCAHAGYQTMMAGIASPPESYFKYANYTEETQGRLADHVRGFEFLQKFQNNVDAYRATFDGLTVFESNFKKDGDTASIEMRKVASFQHENVLYLEAGKRADTDVTRDIKARHSKIWRAVTPSALNAAFNRFSGNDDFDARTTAQFTKINAKRQATPKA